jgi:hypothetical protein
MELILVALEAGSAHCLLPPPVPSLNRLGDPGYVQNQLICFTFDGLDQIRFRHTMQAENGILKAITIPVKGTNRKRYR